MKPPRRLSVLFLFAVAMSAARSAEAQQRWPYQPARPTISPYMNLYRADPGPIDNYNMYVRPQRELQNTLSRQQATLRRQDAGLRSLRQEVSLFGLRRSVRPTGIGGAFMNYSHYYPMLDPQARR